MARQPDVAALSSGGGIPSGVSRTEAGQTIPDEAATPPLSPARPPAIPTAADLLTVDPIPSAERVEPYQGAARRASLDAPWPSPELSPFSAPIDLGAAQRGLNASSAEPSPSAFGVIFGHRSLRVFNECVVSAGAKRSAKAAKSPTPPFARTTWWRTQSGETGLRDRAGLGNREKHTVDGCYCLFWGPKRRGLRFSERLNTRPDNVLADPEPNRPKQNKRKRNAKELPMTGDDSQRFWRFWSAYTLVFTMR